MTDELIKICDPSVLPSIVGAAAKYDHSSKQGSKDIYHLEAFVATVMESIVGLRQQKINR
jgi:hypothetical protein